MVITGVVSPVSTQMVTSAVCGYLVTQPEILERCHLSHEVFQVEMGGGAGPVSQTSDSMIPGFWTTGSTQTLKGNGEWIPWQTGVSLHWR